MIKINSKSKLAILLSKLKGFKNGKVRIDLEQYQTDPEIAAEIIWFAEMNGDISGKVIVDLGCGTGILGIAGLVRGAKKVQFVDIDQNAITIAKENLELAKSQTDEELGRSEFIVSDINDFKTKADIVLQNPPFGIKGKKHADKIFLEKAFETADVIYSFHKAESKQFIQSLSKDKGFRITNYWEFDWPIKMTMKHHIKKIHRVKVGCWRLEKLINN